MSSVAAHVERGNLIFDNVPERAADPGDLLSGYLAGRDATPLGWSPKGQLLIATRFGTVEQLHVVESPAGERRQITFLSEPLTAAAFSPDPARSAYWFLKDTGGADRTQLYYQHIGDSAAKLLTDGKSLNGGAVWSNTGRELAFFSTARDVAHTDIDVVAPETGALPHLAVTGDSAAWGALDWSPDDRKLLVLKTVAVGEAYLYVVDLSTGQKREVDPGAAKVNITGARFSRDGQGVYLISDRDSEFTTLRYVNLFSGERTALSTSAAGDADELVVSRDGRYLSFVTHEPAADKITLMDLKTHQDLTPPKLPAAGLVDHLSFDSEGKRLAFGFSSATQPRDAYVLDVASNRLEAWTHSEVGPLDPAKFAVPRLAECPTFDRQDSHARQIPLYVYEPKTPGPHPVLLEFGAGSAAPFRRGFDPWLQFVVNELGYAVVAPNIRGSSGYGKTYRGLAGGMLRDDAIKDVGAVVVWLGLQSSFDAKHVVVAGTGAGGYLALAALVNYNDRLSGAVDTGGFVDFISYLSTTAPYQQDQRRAEYGDERKPDMRAYLRRISPLTNADRISRPVLVVHGKNDARIPPSEADQIVNRLRSRGVEVWYLQAKDEGHQFDQQSNRVAYYQTVAQFLKSLH